MKAKLADELSPSETGEIMWMISAFWKVAAIAKKMNVSEQTVEIVQSRMNLS